MKLQQLHESSRGEQVSAFLDYLETRCPLPKKHKAVLQQFAAQLFKEGWAYVVRPSNSDFDKGDYDEGRHRLVMPEKYHEKKQRHVLGYRYARYGMRDQDNTNWIFHDEDIEVLTIEGRHADLERLMRHTAALQPE